MFEISVAEEGIVRVSGRLDASQTSKAGTVLDQLNESFTVDFEKLDYISSAGLGIFLVARKRLEESGHTIKMINMNKHIRDVFRYAGMDQIFDIE